MNKARGKKQIIDDFWQKVVKTKGCWLWQGGIGSHIYFRGKLYSHYRFAYLITKGSIGNKLVCHHCDNTQCCRPSHLFKGTYQDNVDDMIAKGRHLINGLHPLKGIKRQGDLKRFAPKNPAFGLRNGAYTKPHRIRRGENNGWAKFTVNQISMIRQLRNSGMRIKDLAKIYNVHRTTITRIVHFQHWKHVTA